MTGEELVAAIQALPGWRLRHVWISAQTTADGRGVEHLASADSVGIDAAGDIEIRGTE